MNNSSHKFDNIDQMDKLFYRYKLSKLTQEGLDKLKATTSVKDIKFVVTNLLIKKTPGLNGSTGNFYQITND